MLKFLMTGAFAGLALTASAANAQTVDQRHIDQQARIHQGERDGQVTYREARGLEHQQRSIDRQEARMRWRHGGHLTWHDRAVLQRRENHASRRIWRDKHNWRRY